jgi:1-acyl-sn-glycerol-3-phosphate acyltransferase
LDKRKVIYYEDELNDEFSLAKITPKRIDKDYKYLRTSPFKRFTRFFWYRIIATPIACLYVKIKFHHKTVNKKLLSKYKDTGIFLYGNHTQDIGDAFIPNVMEKSRSKYTIVHPNNVSIPVIGYVAHSLGALPLPDDIAAAKNFSKAIDYHISKKRCVTIYPEAHIWPYYTGIRNFPDTSFHYPVKYNVPAFCFTNVYKRRGKSNKANIVTYVDGPFYPNEKIAPRERKAELRDRIYECMCRRAALSDIEVIKYIKKEKENA